jgi:hypothetical protein
MRKLLLLAIAGLFATSAHADFTGKDAAAATITFKNPNTCTSVVCVPIFSLFDPTGTNGAAVNTAGADTVSNTANGLLTYSRLLFFNGTTWDRWQGAVNATLSAETTKVIGTVRVASGGIASGSVASGAMASGAYAAGSLAAGAAVDGWDLTQGALADAAATAGSTGSVSAKLRLMTTQLGTINTTLGSPFQAGASIGNTTFAATQATSSNLKAQIDPLTIASWGLAAVTQNVAAPTNGQVVMGQFTTTPTTLTTTNVSPLQMDNAGNLLVNIKTGASSGAVAQGSTTSGQTGLLVQGAVTTAAPSYTTAQTSPFSLDTAGNLRVNVVTGGATGGTALADGATFTEASTSITPIGGEYVSGGGGTCTTGKACGLQMTIDRMAYVNIGKVAGVAIGATAVVNYGSTPAAAPALPVNAFVTNTLTALTPGDAIATGTFASGSPTLGGVLLWNGTTYDRMPGSTTGAQIKVASGGIASGAIASGAVASGAFASGSIASGALASGSIASGAMVDLITFQGTKAAGTAAANSLLAGAIFNTTAPTLTDGQQAALHVSNRGGLLLGNGYPAGSTPITISGTGTTGATTATLATGASVTTYICGFSIRANATAAVTGNATITGTITGTLNFTQWTAPLASGLGITENIFNPCVPASAVNTGIAIISAAPGTGGVVSVTGWGYTL